MNFHDNKHTPPPEYISQKSVQREPNRSMRMGGDYKRGERGEANVAFHNFANVHNVFCNVVGAVRCIIISL